MGHSNLRSSRPSRRSSLRIQFSIQKRFPKRRVFLCYPHSTEVLQYQKSKKVEKEKATGKDDLLKAAEGEGTDCSFSGNEPSGKIFREEVTFKPKVRRAKKERASQARKRVSKPRHLKFRVTTTERQECETKQMLGRTNHTLVGFRWDAAKDFQWVVWLLIARATT